jgi:hypothetical protein
MRTFTTIIGITAIAAAMAPAPASAQTRTSFDLRPGFTSADLEAFATDVGSTLRFRPLDDTAPIGKGAIDLGVQYGGSPIADATGVVARFGVNDRVDIGVTGAMYGRSSYGLVGFDTRIALLRQGWNNSPVTVSIRPSITSLLGWSNVWAGNASFDVTVGRTFGPLSPYGGVATMATGAIERVDNVHLDPVTKTDGLVYAGLAYHWRALVVSGEMQKAESVNYGFRIGTRF